MKITAPHPHANPAILHVNFNPVRIQLPIYRPDYRPPQPIKVKPLSKKSITKPITTTSDILHLMDSLKLPIPSDIYTSLIKECTELGDPFKAIELHQHIRKSGLLSNLTMVNRILLMYVSSGCVGHARQVFDQMLQRDFNSWAVMIAGYVESGEYTEATDLFIVMLREKGFENVGDIQMGFSVSGILVCVLKACLCTMNFELGMQVHGWLWKMGYSRNVVLSSFLINFYGKLKCFEGAQTVFEQACSQNTVVWTSRIVNFCNDDNFEGVVSVFKEMGREGVRKNSYTFSTVLKACGRTSAIVFGRQVHANVMKLGLESDGFVQCALVDLYGKCGFLNDATKMFEIGKSKQNSACCNAMLKNFIQHGFCIEAIKILYEMKVAGLKPCESVFNEVRLFCGSKDLENKMDEKRL